MKKLIDRPINDFDEFNSETDYWTDGQKVFNRFTHLKGANLNEFEYSEIFAKDDKNCYCGEICIKNADSESFKILNYTFAIDKNNVYTITGKVKDADVSSFEVLDDGKFLLWYNKKGNPVYTFKGYARDKNNIYYHSFEGKPKIVKNADLETFFSLKDGYFGKDKSCVFGYGKQIKKAEVKSWVKMSNLKDSLYSKDNSRIYYGFWEIPETDYKSFELVIPENAEEIKWQLAKDKNNYYRNGEIIPFDEFEIYWKELIK